MGEPEFTRQIQAWAQQRNAIIFPNGNPNEVLPVVTMLFNRTKHELLIYDECLGRGNPAFDESMYDAARTLLFNQAHIKIALRHDRSQPTALYTRFSHLKKQFRRQLDVRTASADFREGFETLLNREKNFILSDSLAYRIETDATPQDAVGCFYNAPLATLLATQFKKKFRFCPRYF